MIEVLWPAADTNMALRQVTYGTEHHYHGKGAWERLLSFLPRKLVEKFGMRRSMMTMRRPAAANGVVLQTNLQGAVLQYTGQARRSGLGGDHHFNFRVTPGRPDYQITLVNAVDDQGQEAKLETRFQSRNERAFALRVSTNGMSLDLTLALHRSRYLEFPARPEVISTNGTAAP